MSVIGEQPICLSGGAEGADLQFGMNAGKAGHDVIHFSFANARTKAPAGEVVRLKRDQLVEADEAMIKVNETLQRRFPTSSEYSTSLIRRNWFQVKDADRVYAVSTIKDGKVQGGTAWAVQAFIDRFAGEPCDAFVFDQATERWFKWEGQSWALYDVPRPYGIYAGIGSRDLSVAGKNAIRALYE